MTAPAPGPVTPSPSIRTRRLTPDDLPLMRALNGMFGEVFGEPDTYTGDPPSDAYLRELLADPTFIALVAIDGDRVVGGLVAYEMRKFERRRSEVYVYDLGVVESHRRRGIATTLLQWTTRHAASRGAHAVMIQADRGDTPAINLYTKLGRREDIHHFDLHLPAAE
jgi:aminoglycoside 3-N-acetyltransferase I